MSKTIVVDIDGILTKETYGFGEEYYPKRTPNKYTIQTLQEYSERGYTIVLFSARYPEDLDMTREWLNENNVPFDEIVLGKPQAEFYIDDKAINQLDREVICFSGGIDSLIAWHYLDKPKPIYIRMWHRYQNKEMYCIRKLEEKIPKLKVERVDGVNLGKYETGSKAYISQRNFHLALIASHYGNKIYIVGIKGDKVEDKTHEAFKTMAYAMNFIKKPTELEFKIESPFWQMTKTDIIKWFIDSYPMSYVIDVLKTSVSCYDANTMGSCGACPSCFRKWIALEAAGLKSYRWFRKDIRRWKGIESYKQKVKEGQYDIKRSQDIEEVLSKYSLW